MTRIFRGGVIRIDKDINLLITKMILLSLLLFSLGNIIYPFILFYIPMLLSMILFTLAFFRRKWTLPFGNIVDVIYLFFALTIILILIRPLLHFDLGEYKNQLYNPHAFWGHTLPLVLILGVHNFSMEIVKRYISIYMIIGLCIFSVTIKGVFIDNTNLSFADYQEYLVLISKPLSFLTVSTIVLFIPHFFSKKVKALAILSFLLALFIQAFAARRSGVALMCLVIVFSLYLFCDRKYGIVTKYVVLVFLLLFFILIFYLLSDNFVLLLSRIGEDTRNNVEYYLHKDFNQNSIDWIFGRGLSGTYLCPIGDPEFIPLHRGVIETGYLFYILKGGIIYLIPYILILTIATFKGFFFSKNTFTKGLSLFILYNLLSLYPFGLPSFSVASLFLWIAVVWCMRSDCLKKTDSEIFLLFRSEKK